MEENKRGSEKQKGRKLKNSIGRKDVERVEVRWERKL